MKTRFRTSFLLLGFLFFVTSPVFSVVSPAIKTNEAAGFTLGDQKLHVDDIVNLERKDLEEKIGKKLNFKERIALGFAKRSVKKDLKRGKSPEDIEAALASKYGFSLVGFLLGIFLSLVGVLIAHLIFEKGQSGRKWAWIGAAIGILVFGAAILI